MYGVDLLFFIVVSIGAKRHAQGNRPFHLDYVPVGVIFRPVTQDMWVISLIFPNNGGSNTWLIQ
jgi:hypothetical protein